MALRGILREKGFYSLSNNRYANCILDYGNLNLQFMMFFLNNRRKRINRLQVLELGPRILLLLCKIRRSDVIRTYRRELRQQMERSDVEFMLKQTT